MANLWTFGDSYTYFFQPSLVSIDWRNKYFEWKKFAPKVYGEIIADNLNMALMNEARGGIGNSNIFNIFCSVVDKIKEEDIVVFGWSSTLRFSLVNKHGKWITFTPFDIESEQHMKYKLKNFDDLSSTTVIETLINRKHSLYIEELCNYIKIINMILKNHNVIHWGWEKTISNCNCLYVSGYETIKEETNNEVNDLHWSENGHKKFASFLEKIILDNKEKKSHKKFL